MDSEDVTLLKDRPSASAEVRAPKEISGIRRGLRKFARRRSAVVGAIIVLFLLLFSFVGPLVYRTNQVTTVLANANQPPSAAHLLGTSDVGYDILGRLMAGGQSALEVGIGAAVVAIIIGTWWGALAGYFGGWVDATMMRIADSVLAIPALLLVLLLGTIIQPSVVLLVIEIGAISWAVPARLVRGETLSLRVREFVEAAKGAGASGRWIVFRHMIPNVIGVVIVQTTLSIANSIALFAVISYLGLGPPAPATNWGAMLSNGLNYVYDGYWWEIYPAGIAIVLAVVAFNFIGEGLRDTLESRD
ncbi:ABC transporter permease [Ferrimicrobium sp.]|uniref:ABC transporter permease n=1 Tax=Ferrimicrobium sp. TaxID=2926050 RepID=UPI00260F1B07|nr:ABC transporter permease [Ferrimicrobium sp.]